MNQKEFIDFAEKTFKEMLDVLKAKNNDYANNSKLDNNAFKNLTLIEMYNVASVEQGMFARISDKISRLASFISSGTLSVKGESVMDTLKDTIGYCILFMAYLESKKKNDKQVKEFSQETKVNQLKQATEIAQNANYTNSTFKGESREDW